MNWDFYPYESQRRLRDARDALNSMQRAETVDRMKIEYTRFLSATKNSLYPLQNRMNDLPGFSIWWADRMKNIETDPIAKYFKASRNEVEKAGAEGISVNFTVGQTSISSNGTMLQIGPNGIMRFHPIDGWIPIDHEVSSMKIEGFELIGLPAPLSERNSLDLCLEYIDLLENIVRDAISEFKDKGLEVKSQEVNWENPARTRPCPCKSGRKYKHCHGIQ